MAGVRHLHLEGVPDVPADARRRGETFVPDGRPATTTRFTRARIHEGRRSTNAAVRTALRIRLAHRRLDPLSRHVAAQHQDVVVGPVHVEEVAADVPGPRGRRGRRWRGRGPAPWAARPVRANGAAPRRSGSRRRPAWRPGPRPRAGEVVEEGLGSRRTRIPGDDRAPARRAYPARGQRQRREAAPPRGRRSRRRPRPVEDDRRTGWRAAPSGSASSRAPPAQDGVDADGDPSTTQRLALLRTWPPWVPTPVSCHGPLRTTTWATSTRSSRAGPRAPRGARCGFWTAETVREARREELARLTACANGRGSDDRESASSLACRSRTEIDTGSASPLGRILLGSPLEDRAILRGRVVGPDLPPKGWGGARIPGLPPCPRFPVTRVAHPATLARIDLSDDELDHLAPS